MQFSLKVVCNRKNTEYVRQHVAVLSDYLGLSDELVFSPYWKDYECDILELNGCIGNFNFCTLHQHIVSIGGTEKVSVRGPTDEWECAHFVSQDELCSGKHISFVVCTVRGK